MRPLQPQRRPRWAAQLPQLEVLHTIFVEQGPLCRADWRPLPRAALHTEVVPSSHRAAFLHQLPLALPLTLRPYIVTLLLLLQFFILRPYIDRLALPLTLRHHIVTLFLLLQHLNLRAYIERLVLALARTRRTHDG